MFLLLLISGEDYNSEDWHSEVLRSILSDKNLKSRLMLDWKKIAAQFPNLTVSAIRRFVTNRVVARERDEGRPAFRKCLRKALRMEEMKESEENSTKRKKKLTENDLLVEHYEYLAKALGACQTKQELPDSE